MSDDSVCVDGDVPVFLNYLHIADVINANSCFGFFCAGDKASQRFSKQIIARNNEQAVPGQIFPGNDEIDISNRTELIFVALGAVVDDFEFEFRLSALISLE